MCYWWHSFFKPTFQNTLETIEPLILPDEILYDRIYQHKFPNYTTILDVVDYRIDNHLPLSITPQQYEYISYRNKIINNKFK
jgi:hypothetical protein